MCKNTELFVGVRLMRLMLSVRTDTIVSSWCTGAQQPLKQVDVGWPVTYVGANNTNVTLFVTIHCNTK